VAGLPAEVAVVFDEWLQVMDENAPGAVEGLYAVGSLALDDWRPGSDIDVVAVTAEPADDELVRTLTTAHDVWQERRPDPPVDGPFVAWGDLSVPAMVVSRPWVRQGELHHDAECFEINPVTWYVLARYGVVVRGPRQDRLAISIDREERVAWVRQHVEDHWLAVLAELRGAVGELGEQGTIDGSVVEWCLLGAAQMAYTARTGDVVSKTAAGRWAAGRLQTWARVFDLALRCRAAPGAEVSGTELALVAEAMAVTLALALAR
jgi:hypothetical protein